jgi:hypothetical protein
VYVPPHSTSTLRRKSESFSKAHKVKQGKVLPTAALQTAGSLAAPVNSGWVHVLDCSRRGKTQSLAAKHSHPQCGAHDGMYGRAGRSEGMDGWMGGCMMWAFRGGLFRLGVDFMVSGTQDCIQVTASCGSQRIISTLDAVVLIEVAD